MVFLSNTVEKVLCCLCLCFLCAVNVLFFIYVYRLPEAKCMLAHVCDRYVTGPPPTLYTDKIDQCNTLCSTCRVADPTPTKSPRLLSTRPDTTFIGHRLDRTVNSSTPVFTVTFGRFLLSARTAAKVLGYGQL